MDEFEPAEIDPADVDWKATAEDMQVALTVAEQERLQRCAAYDDQIRYLAARLNEIAGAAGMPVPQSRHPHRSPVEIVRAVRTVVAENGQLREDREQFATLANTLGQHVSALHDTLGLSNEAEPDVAVLAIERLRAGIVTVGAALEQLCCAVRHELDADASARAPIDDPEWAGVHQRLTALAAQHMAVLIDPAVHPVMLAALTAPTASGGEA